MVLPNNVLVKVCFQSRLRILLKSKKTFTDSKNLQIKIVGLKTDFHHNKKKFCRMWDVLLLFIFYPSKYVRALNIIFLEYLHKDV